MTTVERQDRAELMTEYREDLGGGIVANLDQNGYLRIDGVAARTGVLTYLLPDGSVRREYVPPETLFDEDSLASLTGSPVTIEHPGILNADNAAEYSRGSVPSAKPAGEHLQVGVVVTGADAIKAIQTGKRQLSPGYKADLDFTPGEFDGVKYDAVQTRRVYNHLAIVQSARGGAECRLHLDGVNCAVEVREDETTDREVTTMPGSVKLHSGATVEVADASTASTIQNEINDLASRADAADSMVDKAKYDELQGKYDALVEQMDKMKSDMDNKMDADDIGAYIETVESARKLKPGLEYKADGAYMDATAVMAAALGIDATDKSPEYVKGRFDSALELAEKQGIQNQRDGARQDNDNVTDFKTGREKFIEANMKRGA